MRVVSSWDRWAQTAAHWAHFPASHTSWVQTRPQSPHLPSVQRRCGQGVGVGAPVGSGVGVGSAAATVGDGVAVGACTGRVTQPASSSAPSKPASHRFFTFPPPSCFIFYCIGFPVDCKVFSRLLPPVRDV